jgi:N utilization substance protein B
LYLWDRPIVRTRRRRARDLALQILFQCDVGRVPVDEALAAGRGREAGADWEFIDTVCRGAVAHQHALDALIVPLLQGWSLDRLASVDRAILRMALFELQNMDTPPAAVIDEAVELAKRYGTEDSGRFVNGVLGAAVRAAQPPAGSQAGPGV